MARCTVITVLNFHRDTSLSLRRHFAAGKAMSTPRTRNAVAKAPALEKNVGYFGSPSRTGFVPAGLGHRELSKKNEGKVSYHAPNSNSHAEVRHLELN